MVTPTALLALALLASSATADSATAPELLVPEALTRKIETARGWRGSWLGYFEAPSSPPSWKPVSVVVPALDEPVADGMEVGYGVAFEGVDGARPLFLVRGFADLGWTSPRSQERVPPAGVDLFPGVLRIVAVGGSGIVVQTEGRADFRGAFEPELRDLEVAIVDPESARRQVLWREPGPQPLLPRLIWGGDLDRDGRVDLILETPEVRDTPRTFTLLLSSQAPSGQLVGAAAQVSAEMDDCPEEGD